MISIKSEDLIEGIIKCGRTCSWTTMETEINMQMVETSLPVNEPLRHIIPAVKHFSIYIECSSLLSGSLENYCLYIFSYIFTNLERWNFAPQKLFVLVCLASLFFCYKLYYSNFRVNMYYIINYIYYTITEHTYIQYLPYFNICTHAFFM